MLEVNDQNFEAEVVKAQLPVLVDFWASWCGPCRMMSPVLEKAAQTYEGKVKIVKLNVDDSPQTAGQFGITAIPTMILFKGGQESARQTGFLPEDALSRFIDSKL